MGHIATLISRDRHVQKNTAEVCLHGAEAAGAINIYEHLNDGFGELLEAECGLA